MIFLNLTFYISTTHRPETSSFLGPLNGLQCINPVTMNCGARLVHVSKHNRFFCAFTYTVMWRTFSQRLIFINQLVWICYQSKHYEQRNFHYLLNFPKSPKAVVQWHRVIKRQRWIWSKCCYRLVVYFGHILIT